MAYRGKSGVVHDLVMLDDISEDGILRALAKRAGSEEIYTYIGETLISVNPYKQVSGLYGQSQMKKYIGKKDYQNSPHAYAIAERAFRNMQLNSSNECIVITGESGAGKTEASKKCMNYIAFLASKSKRVQRVKEQLLETNPLLEAFGNAKTRRNDNSSRFGKYFEILFKFSDPEGGRISQFLLEKNRVTFQQPGERNFHVFYQMLTDSALCRDLNLSRSHADFRYFSDPSAAKVRTLDDAGDFSETQRAMDWVGISNQDQAAIFGILGGILHLGNVEFSAAGRDKSRVASSDALAKAADLLGFSEQDLETALTHRTVKSATESVRTTLSAEMAAFARDALAKSLYGKVFEWIVKRANETLQCDEYSTSIGVLDIYGFEILGVNGFEQLCINHTNERLHQLFIELTLRKEQEEYKKEGIAWSKIDFFDNLPICNMIEKRHGGIYSLIDEESIFPQGSDASLYKKLSSNVRDRYFEKSAGSAAEGQFQIKHYAGTVQYDTKGMLDANKDTLFVDLVMCCLKSDNPIACELFKDHPAANPGRKANKRPPTTCMQYKTQVANLMETLKSCGQHYIRCIKPNDQKRAGIFDDKMSLEQVRYLGLLENVKVRKAGYAFRMDYDEFMAKYKVTIKGHAEFEPNSKSGTKKILSSNGAKGYEMGKSKVFIKDAKTILGIEDERKKFLDEAAALMPEDDGVIWADKVLGFNKAFARTQLYFVVGGNGFYYCSKEGTLEHFIEKEKVEFIGYNEKEGWMVVSSTYPGKMIDDPKVQLSYLSDNIYGAEVENVVELIKRMGYEIDVSKTSTPPADARDPALYKENKKNIGKGELLAPKLGNGAAKPAMGCCVIS